MLEPLELVWLPMLPALCWNSADVFPARIGPRALLASLRSHEVVIVRADVRDDARAALRIALGAPYSFPASVKIPHPHSTSPSY